MWGQRLNLADELREIRIQHFPDLLEIDALIKVDELVACSGDQFPGHFGVRRPELR